MFTYLKIYRLFNVFLSRAFIQNFHYAFTYCAIKLEFAIFYFIHSMQFQIQEFLVFFFNYSNNP